MSSLNKTTKPKPKAKTKSKIELNEPNVVEPEVKPVDSEPDVIELDEDEEPSDETKDIKFDVKSEEISLEDTKLKLKLTINEPEVITGGFIDDEPIEPEFKANLADLRILWVLKQNPNNMVYVKVKEFIEKDASKYTLRYIDSCIKKERVSLEDKTIYLGELSKSLADNLNNIREKILLLREGRNKI